MNTQKNQKSYPLLITSTDKVLQNVLCFFVAELMMSWSVSEPINFVQHLHKFFLWHHFEAMVVVFLPSFDVGISPVDHPIHNDPDFLVPFFFGLINFHFHAIDFWFESFNFFVEIREFFSDTIFVENSFNICLKVFFVVFGFSLDLLFGNIFLNILNMLEEILLLLDLVHNSLLN